MKRAIQLLMSILTLVGVVYATTPIMVSGFEKGMDSNQWDFHGTSFETVTPLSGKRSLHLNPSTSQQYAETKTAFAGGVYVARMRIRFNSLPSQPVWILADPDAAGIRYANGQLFAGSVSGNGATGVSVVPGTDYVIDLKIDTTASPWLIDAQVNGEACGQWAQPSPAYLTARKFRIGNFNLVTLDAVVDDFVLSLTANDYPIGA